jgi:hypothetical protein
MEHDGKREVNERATNRSALSHPALSARRSWAKRVEVPSWSGQVCVDALQGLRH